MFIPFGFYFTLNSTNSHLNPGKIDSMMFSMSAVNLKGRGKSSFTACNNARKSRETDQLWNAVSL